jgi:hypothetical protein
VVLDQGFVKGGEQTTMFLRQGHKIKVIPLAMSSHGRKRHFAGAIQISGYKYSATRPA